MTTTLRNAGEQLELTHPAFEPGAGVRLRLDEAGALRLLRRFDAASHPGSLRSTLAAARNGFDVRLLPDDVLLREVATSLARGRIHAYRTELHGARPSEREELEPPKPPIEKRLTWIEIVLKDTDGKPVPNERYLLALPDGTELEGTLDGRGRARVDDIVGGVCQVSFPDIDAADWRPHG